MSDKRFIIKEKEGSSLLNKECQILVDTDTGVNYLFVASGYGIALTPLLDRDGKPIVTVPGPTYY